MNSPTAPVSSGIMKFRESHSLRTLLAILFGAMVLGQSKAQESYIIFDNQTGQILEAEKPKEKLQVASLTKIATCMVVAFWFGTRRRDSSMLRSLPIHQLWYGCPMISAPRMSEPLMISSFMMR